MPSRASWRPTRQACLPMTYAEFADKIALAKDARIVTNGNYVAIVIAGIANPDYAAIDTALETALNF